MKPLSAIVSFSQFVMSSDWKLSMKAGFGQYIVAGKRSRFFNENEMCFAMDRTSGKRKQSTFDQGNRSLILDIVFRMKDFPV